MKRLFFLLLSLIILTASFAENVDPNKAKRVARNFATQRERSTVQLQLDVVYSHQMPEKRDAAFYVVNLGDTGFVIVSANDVAHPVLGYSFERPWPTEGNLPPQVTDYLDDLAGQIEFASAQEPDRGTKMEWEELLSVNPNHPSQLKGTRAQVGPLLTTTWDQGQYYNAMCPEDSNGPDGHAVTGCVATAMAQIINYYQYPQQGRGFHSYLYNGFETLSVDYANKTYDYGEMPNMLDSESTTAQLNAVAGLISDCGVAVNTTYLASESSAYDQDARAALINYFKYNPNLSLAEKTFFPNEEWHTMLHSDLDAGHPIYYSGQGSSGHAFVCDGYNSEGYFSFNFGWGGNSNGWYLTDAVLNYNSSQCAIFGIMPDVNGNVIIAQMSGTSTFIVDEPLEFYHVMGNNAYRGYNYSNTCDNTVKFISANNNNQLVADIVEFKDQSLMIYDGSIPNTLLRHLQGSYNVYSPVVSSKKALTMVYSGNLFYAGYKLCISQDEGCRMVSEMIASVELESTTVNLEWMENGEATQWQIEYGVKGFELGNGIVYETNTNSATINNLETLTEYEFYVRSVCGDNEYGLWNKTSIMVDGESWQDVVTSQPEGYVFNPTTRTVEIYTTEGFVWWAKQDCRYDAYLMTDIDLAGYKWQPPHSCGHNFYGNGHVISNLFIFSDAGSNNATGLFSRLSQNRVIDNLGVVNAVVYGGFIGTGCICGDLSGEIRNCFVKNGVVFGNYDVGGIAGSISSYQTGNTALITNSYADVDVTGSIWVGLIAGGSEYGNIRNCYSTGNITLLSYCYHGGVVGYIGDGEVINCYTDSRYDIVGFAGSSIIADTSKFVRTGSDLVLTTPVMFEGQLETGLLSALNTYVIGNNSDQLCTWNTDVNNINGGYPVLGEKYDVQFPNVSDVSIQNVIIGDTYAVTIGWTENGNATHWQVRYRRHDLPDSDYIVINTSDNPTTLYDIPLGHGYDFGVRAVIDDDHVSGWNTTRNVIVDWLYWTDIVTEQPLGFYEDADGNVEISSAEGLAWLSVLVNGFHGQTKQTFEGKTVRLIEDINLDGFRWCPIGRFRVLSSKFSGVFDGQGHSISDMYVKDDHSDLGLFGRVVNASVRNVDLYSGSVTSLNTQNNGSENIGGLIGSASNCVEISNCHSSLNVSGNISIGSLCGDIYYRTDTTKVFNCSASGSVTGRQSCGGLIGSVSSGGSGYMEIYNCYAMGNVIIATGNDRSWSRGGLIGYCIARVDNCYSIGTVDIDPEFNSYFGKVIGCPDYDSPIRYLYGQDVVNYGWGLVGIDDVDIADTTQFHHEGNINTLINSVSIGGDVYDDLLDALNAWVTIQNDNNLKTWILDQNTGYPVFGDNYSSTMTQSQTLSQGWNWWSTYIEQEGVDGLGMLENGLGHNGLAIKSQNDFTTNYYGSIGYDYWYGGLESLTNEQGYMINTSAAANVVLTGVSAKPADHPITIHPNWNWIGYPASQEQLLTATTAGFQPENNDVVKDHSGFAMYYAGYGWYPQDFVMTPGKGYLYNSNATGDKVLTYAINRESASFEKKPNECQWVPETHKYADNISVIAVLEKEGEELRDNVEVGAFVNGECRGTAMLRYFEPTGRYYAMLSVAGEDGDEIDFAMHDEESNLHLTFHMNDIVGSLDSPLQITFDSKNKNTNQAVIYPNPGNGNREFTVAVCDGEQISELMITNLLGELVYSCSVNASSLKCNIAQPGVYVVKTICKSGNTYQNKLVIKH